jgi:hypothetical protein
MGRKTFSLFILFICLVGLIWLTAWVCKTYVFQKPEIDPGFLGALIGAAGTIFAGYMVLMATNEQIRIAKESAAQTEALRLKSAKLQADRELASFKAVVAWYDKLLEPFQNLSHDDDVSYINALELFSREGRMISFAGILPPEFFGGPQTAWQRLLQVRTAVFQWINSHPDPATRVGNDRKEYNGSIRAMVEELLAYRQIAKAELERREDHHG